VISQALLIAYDTIPGFDTGRVRNDQPTRQEEVGSSLQYRRDEGHSLDPGYWKVILNYTEIVFERV
jgi:hypothetical protein